MKLITISNRIDRAIEETDTHQDPDTYNRSEYEMDGRRMTPEEVFSRMEKRLREQFGH